MSAEREDEYKVTSEIHQNSKVDKSAKPIVSPENVVTKFGFKLPSNLGVNSKQEHLIRTDEDGDFILDRSRRIEQEDAILIEQSHSTTLELVGLQVWRGALALADFVLFHGQSLFKDKVVLELASGTGLTSIVAAMFAKEVICTDVDIGGILNLIKANATRNSKYVSAEFTVDGLDFYARQWSNNLEAKLTEVSIVLVADAIYDNDLTEEFVKTLVKILSIPPKKTIFIALEKRYVFTVSDLECVAPCYEHFLSCFNKARSGSHWQVNQIPIDFPQYFNYDRVKELVLWRIISE
ncbi:methyltransferase-like protein 22 isoform X1 [Anabrus simplex]|uniref:methyltransferase-like protein 22 isoform X1 n=1 Tax=Anabrus simplex TaxID=316456 RepID=UPI0035A35850